MSENLWELHIRYADQGRYQFTLANPFVGGLVFNMANEVPLGVRDEVIEKSRPPEDARQVDAWVEEVGQLVAEALLPKTIRTELAGLNGGHLEISTEDPEVPWELASGVDGPLIRRVGVARRIYVASPLTSLAAPPDRRWLDMLLVTNPTGDLDAADDEGEHIKEILSSEPLIRLTVLSGEDATSKNLFEIVGQRRFDVFHYAGHVVGRQGEDSVLELNDTQVTAGYLTNRFSGPPEIVFVNGCRSGLSEGERPTRVMSAGAPTVEGVAYTFLSAGVRSYVGTLWDVLDSAASAVATTFYQEVVAGATIGGALLQARTSVAERGAVAYASHLLYGRATDALVGIQPAIERQRRLRMLREVTRSGENEGRRRRAALLLGELADAEATDLLAAALEDENDAVRWRAVAGLAKIGTPKAMQILVDRLPAADAAFALHIVIMLRDRLSDALSPAMRDVITSANDDVLRANALITLGGIGDASNLDLCTALLDDDDELVQLLALGALGRIGPDALRSMYAYQPESSALEAIRQRLVEKLEDQVP